MQQRPRHTRHTAVAQGMYQGACLVHARATISTIKINNNNHLSSPLLMLKDWNGILKVYSSAQWNLLTNRASIAYLRTHAYELNNIGCECKNLNKHCASVQIVVRTKKCKNILSTQISFPTTLVLFKVTTSKSNTSDIKTSNHRELWGIGH